MDEKNARTEMSKDIEEMGEYRSAAGMVEGICPVCKVFVVSGDQKRYDVVSGFRRVLHEKCV